MLRTAWWFIYFWSFLIFNYPKLSKAEKMENTNERQEFVQKYVQKWSNNLLKLAGVKVNIIGEENLDIDRHAVFVANHQGSFDIPLMLTATGETRGILAKIEMEKMPLVSRWMNNLNCLYVDRKNPKQALKVVINAIKYVKAGNSFTIFPEGTRSKSNEMAEFKKGSTTIAIKGGALIVPVTIDGSYNILEKNKGFKITPADINITIHKAIDPLLLNDVEIEKIDEMIFQIIKSSLPK